ncbi:MAG: lysophospholipid acyltransferase family protein [bacterium]|nr:lysophospholipid acyltransferase family protein [bacterium]
MAWFYFGIRILTLFPRKLGMLIARKITPITYYGYYKDRRAYVISNLKKIYKDLDEIEAKKMVYTIFTNFAVFVYEFIMLPTLNKNNLKDYVKIVNKENLDSALKQGKGAVVLTAHLGHWELGAAVLGLLGYSPVSISLPQPSTYTRKFFTGRRKSVGIETHYIDPKDPYSLSLKPILIALKQGKVLATVGDRRYSGHAIKANFLNTTLDFPSGTFTLAQHTGSPIIPAFCVKENDKYSIYFEPELKDGVQGWANILDRYVRKYVTQWYVFDKLWQ